MIVETERLILRKWKPEDREPFAVMNADPRVMEFMLEPLTREKSDAMVDRIEAHFTLHGYGLYALEEKEGGHFVGFTGLAHVPFEAHFVPAVEIGWRLSYDSWGKGYATEAAGNVLKYAFGKMGMNEIVSFTVPANYRSRNVMEKIGMTNKSEDNFDHPRIEKMHKLCRHVLYRIQV